MKVRIAVDRCEGHGRCWDIAPAVFDCDEVGRGRVAVEELDPSLEAVARQAVMACPEGAITLEPA